MTFSISLRLLAATKQIASQYHKGVHIYSFFLAEKQQRLKGVCGKQREEAKNGEGRFAEQRQG